MGKEPVDLNEIEAVEREVDELRQRTEALLGELEKRIGATVEKAKDGVERVKHGVERAREVADLPEQVRRHPRAAAGIGAGTLLAIGFGVWLLVERRAEKQRLANRMRRRARAYRALLANPERALAAREPSMGRKLVTAILVTAATAVVKRLATRSVERALPAR